MSEKKKIALKELWGDVELWLDGIEGAVGGRCYPEHSVEGVRYIQHLVRGHLTSIDELLAAIEHRGQGVKDECDVTSEGTETGATKNG